MVNKTVITFGIDRRPMDLSESPGRSANPGPFAVVFAQARTIPSLRPTYSVAPTGDDDSQGTVVGPAPAMQSFGILGIHFT